MELSLSTIFFLLVAFAVGAAVMLFMIGQWLDLTGLRYRMESSRNALNLLQLIVSNSPLIEEDIYFEPNKLILEEAKLDAHEYTVYDMYDQSESILNDKFHECCQFLDFDYKLTVIDLESDPIELWNIGDIPFKIESKCYPDRIIGHADMPVVIHRDDGSYKPGLINITLVKTPLSELSFWLSQSFIRAEWDKSREFFKKAESDVGVSFEVRVPIDPEINTITIDKDAKTVCMKFASGRIACKKFVTTDATLFLEEDPITIVGDCYNVLIVTDIENQRVEVR